MINTQILPADVPSIPAALEVLNAGGLVAFPTDTVYGLAAAMMDDNAIQALYDVKGRESTKAIALLIGTLEQIHVITPGFTGIANQLALRFWPGALTLVVPRRPELPASLSAYPTVGVRMPNHPFALALLCQAGPLAVTSANLSGQPSAVTAGQVLEQLAGRIPLILDGGACPGGVPSTVVDCTAPEPVILRQGAIKPADLGL